MPNLVKEGFLKNLSSRFGKSKKISESNSLFEIANEQLRIYIRYSKLHNGFRTFYGLRKEDLKILQGRNSFLCLLWDNQEEPLIIPYSEFEDVFGIVKPASDGQFKVQVYVTKNGTEFYIANSGRYNVEGYYGFEVLADAIDSSKIEKIPELSHSDVQSLLSVIGDAKGFDVWIPQNNRTRLNHFSKKPTLRNYLPSDLKKIGSILQEIDVIWFERGASIPCGFFEVEHSTPIYSGLLRFNDVHLIMPNLNSKFNIVSNEIRRALFARQIMRPTFQTSGLANFCSFLEYKDVFHWFNRISKKA